jgi:hypothetical protein
LLICRFADLLLAAVTATGHSESTHREMARQNTMGGMND